MKTQVALPESPKAGSALTCSSEHVTSDHPQIGVKAELLAGERESTPLPKPPAIAKFHFPTQPQHPHRMATMSKAVPVESKSAAPAPKNSKGEANVAAHTRDKNIELALSSITKQFGE